MPPRRTFARTWWGKAWTDALERRAQLDPNRLPRGRTYAGTGRVRSMELVPGEIRAVVQGSRTAPYSVRVGITTFSEAEWDRLLDAIASRAGHAAALLDGELDPAIVEDAERVGVTLLPGPGDLTPRCSCPDWADPCKHAAAACYLVASELDRDPFSLLLLRGRSRAQVLDALRTRRAASGSRGRRRAGRAPLADPGVRAAEAWARSLGPLPAPPVRRDHPGRTAPLPTEPPAHLGFTAETLAALADDAARRAWHALRGEAATGVVEGELADLARRAHDALEAALPSGHDGGVPTGGVAAFDELVGRSGRRARDLMADAEAWAEAGGAGVLAMHEAVWSPPIARMAAGRDAVVASGAAPSQVRVRNNTITVAGKTQLRLARDGRWYRLDKRGGRWALTAPAADEADDLVFTRSSALDDED